MRLLLSATRLDFSAPYTKILIFRFRYQSEPDYDLWKHLLRICHLDLEDLPSVDAFLRTCRQDLPHLDLLVNNAAQTIQRPREFYSSLLDTEASDRRLADEATVLRLDTDYKNNVVNYFFSPSNFLNKSVLLVNASNS